MKQTRLLMGMPIIVEIVDKWAKQGDFDKVYNYFEYIDHKFSTYKNDSEVSAINTGRLNISEVTGDLKEVLALCEETKKLTNGYFNAVHYGRLDPSGLVKGWAINNAANILLDSGFNNFYINAGGDVQTYGNNSMGVPWQVGIRSPFARTQNIKVLSITGIGIATSGTYVRGQHIYDPFNEDKKLTQILSITVIGPNIYEADRFATAAFAMEKHGIEFIERLRGFEGYMIDSEGVGTSTINFEKYVTKTDI
jgi:FAD:protein FMN transferase